MSNLFNNFLNFHPPTAYPIGQYDLRYEKVTNLPHSVEDQGEDRDVWQAHLVIWLDGGAWNVTPPVQVESERGEDVEEDGCELVQAVEHQAVLPDYDGQHKDTHGEDIVGLE